jgi:hypothetical protein
LAQTARDNWAKVAAAIGTLPDGDAIARLLAHLTAEHELLVEAFSEDKPRAPADKGEPPMPSWNKTRGELSLDGNCIKKSRILGQR